MSAVLTDVDTVEVSLVDRGANMKRFALRKQEKKMAKVTMTKAQRTELAKALSSKTLGQVQKALADVSPEGRKAIMAAIGLLANAQAQLPEGLLQEIMTAAGIESPQDMVDLIAGDSAADHADGDMPDGDGDGDTEGEPVADSAATTTPGDTMPTPKPTPPAAPQQKDDMYKAELAKVQKNADDAKAQLAKLEKQAKVDADKRVELEKQVKVEKDARLTRDYIAKAAAKYGQLPMKSDELGPVLKSLADVVPPELMEKLEKLLEATNEKAKTLADALTKELGHASDGGERTAMTTLEKATEALMKADTKLTKPQAMSKALKMNPSLYDEYNKEQQEQAA